MYQPGRNPALKEYNEWESQSWIEIVEDVAADETTVFLPVEKAKAYLAANNSDRLNNILCELFESEYPPVDSELILRDHIAVFCVLLSIGHGREIEYFAQYEELSDRRLPFDYNHPVAEFPDVDDDPSFLERFCEKQQMYCVPVFDGFMQHKRFGAQRLLPITSKAPLGIHGSASDYLITIYRPLNKLLPRSKQPSEKGPTADMFVLRQYALKASERAYRDEVNGFRSVKNSDSIIRFYGSYIHGDTFNTLLEYADKGSLEDYFTREAPPSRGGDIVKFWDSMFQLIKGLKAIHSARLGHFGVTPTNILVLSHGSDQPSHWQFKFASFGVIPKDGERMSDCTDSSSYAPPECYSPYRVDGQQSSPTSKISWAADIWSLGCIYSEAAVWIADGYKGLLDYRKQRETETSRILFKAGDCFHDGERALQTVLDTHGDIEDRLRRSDYITKDVLESMVDEMMWEEDRPNAKALMRKSEMVLARARQKLPASSGDEFSRPGSRQARPLPARRQPPPTTPLPPLPRGAIPHLTSIAEQQYPLNVEKWRSQVAGPQSVVTNFTSTSPPASDFSSQSFPRHRSVAPETISDLDREIGGSIASWNNGDNDSNISPYTPLTSPHASVQYDYHLPNEGRPRTLQSQTSYEYRRHPAISQAPSTVNGDTDFPDSVSMVHSAIVQTASQIPYTKPSSAVTSTTDLSVASTSIQEPAPAPSLGRATSKSSSSRHSTYSSPSVQKDSFFSSAKSAEEVQPSGRMKVKRGITGFSLFPTKIRTNSNAATHEAALGGNNLLSRSSTKDSGPSTPGSAPGSMGTTPIVTELTPLYLSLATCLEWKASQKKFKKSKCPPLPGARILDSLHGRDHIFIVDDSASMAPVWPNVKRVFDALATVTKGMSPDGTELYFTVSYDTWRRKDPADLITGVEKKTTAGSTRINFRLNLLLEGFRARRPKLLAGGQKKHVVRPMSIYVLTNGEWGEGPDPKITLQKTADCLKARGETEGVAVQFISFAETAIGLNRLNSLAKTDYGVDIVDCTPWTGNVLKMIKGALDRSLPEENQGSGFFNKQFIDFARLGLESATTQGSDELKSPGA